MTGERERWPGRDYLSRMAAGAARSQIADLVGPTRVEERRYGPGLTDGKSGDRDVAPFAVHAIGR